MFAAAEPTDGCRLLFQLPPDSSPSYLDLLRHLCSVGMVTVSRTLPNLSDDSREPCTRKHRTVLVRPIKINLFQMEYLLLMLYIFLLYLLSYSFDSLVYWRITTVYKRIKTAPFKIINYDHAVWLQRLLWFTILNNLIFFRITLFKSPVLKSKRLLDRDRVNSIRFRMRRKMKSTLPFLTC